jgi:hypothetical protein
MTSKTTLLPEYIGIVQNTSLNFYNKSTNLLTAIGDYLAELNECIKFNKCLVSTNMLSSYGVLYNELNNTDFTVDNFTLVNGEITSAGTKKLPNSFILYFVEKYLSLSKEYKIKVNAIVGNKNYFAPFSDDIGYITDTSSIMDNNVNPYFDIYNQQYFLQTNIPATLNKKISKNEFKILKSFSYYADSLLKCNLVGLQTGNLNTDTAKTAHGTNLITDILYYKRAINNQQAFLTELQVVLGDISNFIMFFKNINPKDKNPERKAILMKYTITDLEGLELRVDAIKNDINKISLSSKDVLDANLFQ